jgi:hypothetical protein
LARDTVSLISEQEADFILDVINLQSVAVNSKEWQAARREVRRSAKKTVQGRPDVSMPAVFAVILLADFWHAKTGGLPSSSGTKPSDFQEFVTQFCSQFSCPPLTQRPMRAAISAWKKRYLEETNKEYPKTFGYFSGVFKITPVAKI